MKNLAWMSFLCFLYTWTIHGQVARTILNEKDFASFGTLRNEGLSGNGKWTSYSMSYESGLDTLFVSQIDGKNKIAIPNGRNGRFIGDHLFCCLKDGKIFQVLNLDKGSVWEESNIRRYEITANLRNIVLVMENPDKRLSVHIRDFQGNAIKELTDIISYCFDPAIRNIAYCRTDGKSIVEICRLSEKMESLEIMRGFGYFEHFSWQINGLSVAFLHRENDVANAVYFYDCLKRKTYCSTELEKELSINVPYGEYLNISPDGKGVFFTVTKYSRDKQDLGTAQIWNAADSFLYSRRKDLGESLLWVKWKPETDRIIPIGTNELPNSIFTADYRYAVCYSGIENAPSPKNYPDRDCFLLNLENGRQTLLERQVSGSPNEIRISPIGSLISYRHKGNWIVIDPNTSMRFNIAADIIDQVSNMSFLAWTSDGRSILFADDRDIWEFDWNSKSTKRITNGNESDMFFQLADDSRVVDKDRIVLTIRNEDYSYTGFGVLEKGKYRQLLFDKFKVSGIHLGTEICNFSFLTERFDQSPKLESFVNGLRSEVHRSNVFANKYAWGKSSVMEYEVRGQKQKGVLFYPFGFQEGKKYPMVVHLYELQNRQLHEFVNPTLHNSYGFNISLLASQGYFVFLPDIVYRVGQPGFSASECVIAATSSVCDLYPVDRSRIGLIGHSFGGYEANFTVTQTDIFRCAVSGAGISDYMSSYFSEDKNFTNVSYWRFESDQRRMGYPFFENKEGYLLNSPVFHARNIKTPLLQFTGEQDTQVTPAQSFELYLALRRLNKENILLVYPKEGHILLQRGNQEDLTRKIIDWFGCYLMDNPKSKWMYPQ